MGSSYVSNMLAGVLTAFGFRRNLEPNFTHYQCEQQGKWESMKNQDSVTTVITLLLLLPWLGRVAVSSMAVWRAHMESQTEKAKERRP